MSALTVFQYQAEHSVRSVLINGEAYIVAADICTAIGIAKHRDAVTQLEDDERASTVVDTPGGPQRMTVVNEAGMYALMLISRSPKVRPFRRWITHEVLPAIRKTGTYGTAPALDAPPSYPELLRAHADLLEEADRQRAELEAAAPKAEAFDVLMSSDGTYSIEAAAKALAPVTGGWGRNRLFRWLREEGVLQANNLPYQRYAHWFRVVVGTYTRHDGTEVPTYTTKVRPEGVDAIRRRLSRPLAVVGGES